MKLKCLLPAFALGTILATGCNPNPEQKVGLPPAEKRIDQLLEKSKGSWDALTPEERKEVITTIGNGNETTAKVNFSARASTSLPPAAGGR
jgi:hypothetical protein